MSEPFFKRSLKNAAAPTFGREISYPVATPHLKAAETGRRGDSLSPRPHVFQSSRFVPASYFNLLNTANLVGYSGNIANPAEFGQPGSRFL